MAMTFGERIKAGARRSALGATGGLCLLVGAGFLTASAWLALEIVAGPAYASLIVGLAYVGAGAVAMGLAQRRAPEQQPSTAAPVAAPPPGATGMPDVVAAFTQGLGAGLAARKNTRT